MSSWPYIVPLLATRCLHQVGSIWLKVSLTRRLTKCQADLRCLYQGGPSDISVKRTSENLNTPVIWGLASQRSFLRKTNKVIWWKKNCTSYVIGFHIKRWILSKKYIYVASCIENGFKLTVSACSSLSSTSPMCLPADKPVSVKQHSSNSLVPLSPQTCTEGVPVCVYGICCPSYTGFVTGKQRNYVQGMILEILVQDCHWWSKH